MPRYEVPVTETPGLRPEDRPAMREDGREGPSRHGTCSPTWTEPSSSRRLTILPRTTELDRRAASRIGNDVIGSRRPGQRGARPLRRNRSASGGRHRCSADAATTRLSRPFVSPTAPWPASASIASSRSRGAAAKSKPLADFELRRTGRGVRSSSPSCCCRFRRSPIRRTRTAPSPSKPSPICSGSRRAAARPKPIWASPPSRWPSAACRAIVGGFDGGRGPHRHHALHAAPADAAAVPARGDPDLRDGAHPSGGDGSGDQSSGAEPFTLGLWVGNKVTPGHDRGQPQGHRGHPQSRDSTDAGGTSPAQLTSCPWCGCEIQPGRDIEVDKTPDARPSTAATSSGSANSARAKSSNNAHPGIPVMVVDEEIYHRPPTMMIATVDKFAMMAWRGEVRTLFGSVRDGMRAPRSALAGRTTARGRHNAHKAHCRARRSKPCARVRPPDLIIQDEFHLISGPLGTMVGLYETAIDDLCSWKLGQDERCAQRSSHRRRRCDSAAEQVDNVFMRRVAIFPPKALDVEDNFFSVQRSVESKPGRRYIGICSPGSSRPAVLIRIYTAFLTAAQALFDRVRPGGRPVYDAGRLLQLAARARRHEAPRRRRRPDAFLPREDEPVERPGLEQRSVSNIGELTSRVSQPRHPEVPRPARDQVQRRLRPGHGQVTSRACGRRRRTADRRRARDEHALRRRRRESPGRHGRERPAERHGRVHPGDEPRRAARSRLVCTVLTWARPRDLSHYETFEHYHATFYKHVEAQSVTPFSPRAMDRGLTGTLLSVMRLETLRAFNPNPGAGALTSPTGQEAVDARDLLVDRAWEMSHEAAIEEPRHRRAEGAPRRMGEGGGQGRPNARLREEGPAGHDGRAAEAPGIQAWDIHRSHVDARGRAGRALVMSTARFGGNDPAWLPTPPYRR